MFLSWEGIPPLCSHGARERSSKYVVGQSSVGCGRHSRHSLVNRVARRAYRGRSDPYSAGDRSDYLVVQPLCGNAQTGVGRLSTALEDE